MKQIGIIIETNRGALVPMIPLEEGDGTGLRVFNISDLNGQMHAGTIMETDDDGNMLIEYDNKLRELHPAFSNILYKEMDTHSVIQRELLQMFNELIKKQIQINKNQIEINNGLLDDLNNDNPQP